MSKKAAVCPTCKNMGKLFKSHSKNIFERIINHTYVFGTYRCHNCGWRGIRLRKGNLNFSFSSIVKTVLMFLVVYYIALYFIKNYSN